MYNLYDELITIFKERDSEQLINNENIPFHKHHIIPKHAGGDNNEKNLVKVNLIEHYLLHFVLFKQNNSTKDFHAAMMLSGNCGKSAIARGKAGALVCKNKGVNAFYDPILRKEICKKGGQVTGKMNAESGHLKRISIATAKQRSEKMKRKIQWTNGIKNLSLDKDIKPPEEFFKGQVKRKKGTDIFVVYKFNDDNRKRRKI